MIGDYPQARHPTSEEARENDFGTSDSVRRIDRVACASFRLVLKTAFQVLVKHQDRAAVADKAPESRLKEGLPPTYRGYVRHNV